VSRKIAWSRNAVCKRGAELGVTQAKERRWSAAEQDLLQQFGHVAPSGIRWEFGAADFCRFITAIQIKLNRTRIKQNLEGYSAAVWPMRGAWMCIRFSPGSEEVFWAVRRDTDRSHIQGRDTRWISDRAVKRFILRAPEKIDLARVERIGSLDLWTRDKIGSQRLSG
jgi:hypothetical protein